MVFGLTIFNDIKYCRCQVKGISRCTCLVVHDLERRLARCQCKHGLDEIPPEFAVKPRCTDDDVAAAAPADHFLALKLGQSIDSCRRCRRILIQRCVIDYSAEDIICRYMDQKSALFTDSYSKIFRRFCIEEPAGINICFSLVHIGIGSTVYNDVYIIF